MNCLLAKMEIINVVHVNGLLTKMEIHNVVHVNHLLVKMEIRNVASVLCRIKMLPVAEMPTAPILSEVFRFLHAPSDITIT